MKWFKDLLYGPGNLYLDLGRVLAFLLPLAMVGGAGWNVWLGLPLDLGPAGLGGGLAAVATAVAALIYVKDKSGAPSPAQPLVAPPSPAAKKRCRKAPSKAKR